jgi:1-deoxy-D-xylulose-5-phosphate synthase
MYKYLDAINGPEDIKSFGPEERKELAVEIRDRIMRVVSKNGGHFGSNFGVVELTIALHTVFNSPHDQILFDTSHQCYPHKLLTGRHKSFDSLRTYEGISGFCHKGESPHDIAFAGHAGTIASLALGCAAGTDLNEDGRYVVGVVGDSSIVTGMSFEALNHAGHIRKKYLLILNDNDMAISYPVGGFHRYLDTVRTNPLYKEFKKDVESLLDKVPVIGESLHDGLLHLKDALKHALIPGRVFEDLGLRYFGPVDGHDTEAVIRALNAVKDFEEPVLLHVVTKKGAGWAPALEDPIKWHAAKGFLEEETKEEDKSGKEEGKLEVPKPAVGPRWTKIFDNAIVELGQEDEKIIALTAAMPGGTGLSRFAGMFPKRFFDVGICEQHGTAFASGLSYAGLKPVFAVYSTFLQRSFDQVIHDVAIQNNPVVFCMDRGGLVGADGVTHQGLFDISYLRGIPRMVLLAPKDGPELRAMLRWAVNSGKICGIRWPRATVPIPMAAEPAPIVLGKGEVIHEGEDICFFAYGAMVDLCRSACDMLKREGIRPTLVNARFAKPFPTDLLIEQAEKHRLVFTVEDHVKAGGFGSAGLQGLCETRPDLLPRIRILGVEDAFIDHGDRSLQLRDQGLDAAGLAKTVQAVLLKESAKPV